MRQSPTETLDSYLIRCCDRFEDVWSKDLDILKIKHNTDTTGRTFFDVDLSCSHDPIQKC